MTDALTASGYAGIWYGTPPEATTFKYAGGLGTYPSQQGPQAIHVAAARKTFFTYGGRSPEGKLQNMVGYFDHAMQMFARPRIWATRDIDVDAHDNSCLAIDSDGYLYLFLNAHGTDDGKKSFIRRSTAPYGIGAYTEMLTRADDPLFGSPRQFSYAWPWIVGGKFLFFHTRYGRTSAGSERRESWLTTSLDGNAWSTPQQIAAVSKGHYTLARPCDERVGLVLDLHPSPKGLNARTNLHFMWRNADGSYETVNGTPVSVPLLKQTQLVPLLVRDYQAEGKLVFAKHLTFDAFGHPVVTFLTSDRMDPGPGASQMVHTARWDGAAWIIRDVCATDHNYDHGELRIGADGSWSLIGTFIAGPQAYGAGGQISEHTSWDQGLTWTMINRTQGIGTYNHSHPRRPVDAHGDLVAIWADGNAHESSSSCLFAMNADGEVIRLPTTMTSDFAPGLPAQLEAS